MLAYKLQAPLARAKQKLPRPPTSFSYTHSTKNPEEAEPFQVGPSSLGNLQKIYSAQKGFIFLIFQINFYHNLIIFGTEFSIVKSLSPSWPPTDSELFQGMGPGNKVLKHGLLESVCLKS